MKCKDCARGAHVLCDWCCCFLGVPEFVDCAHSTANPIMVADLRREVAADEESEEE